MKLKLDNVVFLSTSVSDTNRLGVSQSASPRVEGLLDSGSMMEEFASNSTTPINCGYHKCWTTYADFLDKLHVQMCCHNSSRYAVERRFVIIYARFYNVKIAQKNEVQVARSRYIA
jgi:hypothetical protein